MFINNKTEGRWLTSVLAVVIDITGTPYRVPIQEPRGVREREGRTIETTNQSGKKKFYQSLTYPGFREL